MSVGYGTVVGAPDALKLWDTIGANYRLVRTGDRELHVISSEEPTTNHQSPA